MLSHLKDVTASLLFVLLVLCAHTTVDAAACPSTIYNYLKQNLSPKSEVFLPDASDETMEIVQRWNAYNTPHYIVFAKPATNKDVQTIVKYSNDKNVPFLATGGGNGYTNTTSALKGAIDVDLGFFRSVSVDAPNNRVTVGGAATFDDIFGPISAAKKELQTGSCSCVGVVGATLGGGIGPYQGIHGLILDALISVTVVTGKGDIVTASTGENQDLFWGLRGAGFNYGVITSATYRIHDQTNNGLALNGDFIYPTSAKEHVFNVVKTYENNQPNELSIFASIMLDPVTQVTVILISAIYIGPEEEGLAYIQPLIDSNPVRSNISSIPWSRLVKENRFGADQFACLKGGNHSVFGGNLATFDVSTYVSLVDEFIQFYTENPALATAILVVEMFPNAVTKSIPDDATAYPYRDSFAYFFFSFVFSDVASGAIAERAGLTWRNKLMSTGGKDGKLEVYVNYAHGDEGRVAWYAPRKIPKLLAIKSKWDPQNLFKWTNGLV